MPPDEKPPTTMLKVWLTMGLFVVAGIPLVAYLWETLNQLLGGHLGARRFWLSIPMLAAFGGLLYLLARNLKRL